MATTETTYQPQAQHDRPGRRRPFSTWMKKLASFKGSSSTDANQPSGSKRSAHQLKSNFKKHSKPKNNSPYLTSTQFNPDSTSPNGHTSYSSVPTGRTASTSSLDHHRRSFRSSVDGAHPPTIGNRSVAQTISTEHDVEHSDAAQSHAASSGARTAGTVGPSTVGRGADSTFSSPAPSLRSLTTTLTTIHSAGVGQGGGANAVHYSQGGPHGSHSNNTHSIQFTHQFPTSPIPPTALPAHLVPQGSGGHPATYSMATANNLLTDNASILTLASSSKRRRRRSMDTDASVRALAPSSLFGGSRESLPLSVLSANIDSHSSAPPVALHSTRSNIGGPGERASIYSAAGVAPALPSERNSYYAGKQNILGDGGSIKSGLLGHGRTESVSGSIGGIGAAGSPLASPREGIVPLQPGRVSRRNSTQRDGDAGATEAERVEDDNETVVKE